MSLSQCVAAKGRWAMKLESMVSAFEFFVLRLFWSTEISFVDSCCRFYGLSLYCMRLDLLE